MTTIILDIGFDCMGEISEGVAEVYAKEVEQCIESEYPDALVSVYVDFCGFGGLSVISDSYDEQDEIRERVNYIGRDVWDNGSWHNAA
ncbi:hypothetical protein P4K07_004216 [Salmonella enterica]|nr:hypothetical protein [Salmonella enterica]